MLISQNSEPIRLLKTLRSLSVYILMKIIRSQSVGAQLQVYAVCTLRMPRAGECVNGSRDKHAKDGNITEYPSTYIKPQKPAIAVPQSHTIYAHIFHSTFIYVVT